MFLHLASPFHFNVTDVEKELLLPAVDGTKMYYKQFIILVTILKKWLSLHLMLPLVPLLKKLIKCNYYRKGLE